MKSNNQFGKKILSMIIFSTFFLAIFTQSDLNQEFYVLEDEDRETNIGNKNPKSSGFWIGVPINIDDASAFDWDYYNTTYTWINGAGTWSNPYVIENVTIDANGGSYGIGIDNSNVYFRIKNCTIINATLSSNSAGIGINNVTNGLIIGNNCSFNAVGIYLWGSRNITVQENIIHNNTV